MINQPLYAIFSKARIKLTATLSIFSWKPDILLICKNQEITKKPRQILSMTIGKLIYFLYGTRPDISFAVKQLSRYNVNPQISYIKTAKKVIHYLKDKIHLGLIYGCYFKDKREIKASIILFLFRLIKYEDSSYTENLKNKKFVIGYCYFINRVVISWCSKKQRFVSTFTIKAKYIIFGYAIWETIWLKHFFNKLQVFESINCITLYRDNKTSIILTKNVKNQH